MELRWRSFPFYTRLSLHQEALEHARLDGEMHFYLIFCLNSLQMR